MNIEEIRALLELFDKSDLVEMEVVENDSSIRLSRESRRPYTPILDTLNMSPPPIPSPAISSVSVAPVVPSGEEKKTLDAPMVGTFYLASSPTAEPFVKMGQSVRVGDIICIISAMKMFNQIEATQSGKIVARLVNDGEAVEFGQPLFEIE